MARLFAMCGLSFSGKTTLARAIGTAVGAEYVSLDDINEDHASKFEVPAADEQALICTRNLDVKEWLA